MEEEKIESGKEELQKGEPPAPPAEKEEPKIEEPAVKMVPLAALEDERRKRQELEAKLSQAPPESETYFPSAEVDKVFKDYLKNPAKVIGDITDEIKRLRAAKPDNMEEMIDHWTGIKEQFFAKRIEVSEKKRDLEIQEAKVAAELGAEAATLLSYAKTLGFSERDFTTKPALRASVKKMYLADNPGKGKEIKPIPQKSAATSGSEGGGSGGGEIDEFDPNLSTEERIALSRKRRAAGG